MKTTTSKTSGFTLVELAIVLVIIGLIIGGVLVGQDLIHAAGIRSAVSDIEKFNAGATTFRGKYNGLPGDLVASRAVEFNFSPAATNNSTGAVGYRDGNGVLEAGALNAALIGGEDALFWQDLGASGLIAGTFPGVGTSTTGTMLAITAATLPTYVPHSKLRDSASYFVFSNAGRNFYGIASLTQAAAGASMGTAGAITPVEARGIDEKIDDGFPTTGVVVSLTAAAAATTGATVAVPYMGAAAGPTICNTSATPSLYNDAQNNVNGAPDNPVCLLQLRTAF